MSVKILEVYNDEGQMVVKQILPPKKDSWLSAVIVGISVGLVLFVLLFTCERHSKRF